MSRCLVILASIGVLLTCVGAGSGTTQDGSGAAPAGRAEYPALEDLPGATSDPAVRQLWIEGRARRKAGDMLGATELYERIAAMQPRGRHTHWLIAQCYWEHADQVPDDQTAARAWYYEKVRDWATRGLAIDAGCGECYLYQAAGLGGQARLRSQVVAATQVAEIATALERGIAIMSARPDRDTNPELEELYYAAAQLYRRVPEWSWLRWVLGVSGDRRRAVEYMRKANQIAGRRPEYMVELGASLVCLGHEEKDAALVAEGEGLLRQVVALPQRRHEDAVDWRNAEALLADAAQACGFSRDGA
jgi:hypothetical protein